MKFKVVEVADCAIYRGKVYTYSVTVETVAGEIKFSETTSITPEDEGKTLEMEVEKFGTIIEKVTDPKGIINVEGDHQEFEGTLKEISEKEFTAEIDGLELVVEKLDSNEDWSEYEKGDTVRFSTSFYP
ncbi:hypothetical protein [Candidatus Nanohalococcus occultus]|uniref:hypothetical protein n=1 Tax=Candidatus Nanohalococcus occultus TaxID=2978047 RepID=UPI0039E129BB